MAYIFFPKTESEIKRKLKNSDTKKVSEIISVFKYLKENFNIETPINIDPQALSKINVTRSLQGEVDLASIKRKTMISRISLKFGNGSSGGRGINNKGNLFEGKYAQSIRDWWDTGNLPSAPIGDSISSLQKIYSLNKLKNLGVTVVEEGSLNQPRPLIFTPKILISNKSGVVGNDIGKIVTDITLRSNEKDIGYLSLKEGPSVTFFNAGVISILTPEEINAGEIQNENGAKLLRMFGIDSIEFCKVFNGEMKQGYSVNTWDKMKYRDKNNLKDLLMSGIGYGYTVVHRLTGQIKTYYVDEQYLEQASSPSSCTVYYKGKTGTGKRVDVEIKTGKYVLKVNIRDKQGKSGYPSHIMCDFKYL